MYTVTYPMPNSFDDYEDYGDCEVGRPDPEIESKWFGLKSGNEIYMIEAGVKEVEKIAMDMFGLCGKGVGYPSFEACMTGLGVSETEDKIRISVRYADGKIVRNIWDGEVCEKCKEFYPYAVANMGCGRFKCYGCRR